MEGQLHRTHDHHLHGEDPHGLHPVMEGEVEAEHNHNQHGEKKSVLTKVKDKAKKIKDKIKHAGHSHDDDDHYDYDDEDEETVNRPGVHTDAPMVKESAFISGTALPKQTGLNLENPTVPLEDRLAPSERDDDVRNVGVATHLNPRNEVRSAIMEDDPSSKISSAPLQDIYSPIIRTGHISGTRDTGICREEVGPQSQLGRHSDPLSGPRHVGIGGEEVGPLSQFGKHIDPLSGATDIRIGGERVGSQPQHGRHTDPLSGTRERVGPQPQPQPQLTRENEPLSGGEKLGPQLQLGRDTDPLFCAGDVGNRPQLGGDTDALPTSVDSGRRSYVAADPTVKIGPLEGLEVDPHGPNAVPSSNYQSKVADPAGLGGGEVDVTPLLNRLDNLHVDDESALKDESEEMDYTGSHDQFAPEPTIPASQQYSPKSFDAERPEAMPRDSVTGKISAATSVIADKAVAAKNAVASKLGYGGSTLDQEEMETEVEVGRPQKAPLMETVSEYGHKVAEQLAPVYEKAAGAGSAIMSKVQGRGGGGAAAAEEEGVVKESDKGVSVQSYLVEKLSPGEEDRELSKVITEAIHRKKEGQEQMQQPIKETVTVEAVAADEKAAAGVVDRVKGAIGSWLGKRGDDEGEAAGEGLEKEIGRKLQE